MSWYQLARDVLHMVDRLTPEQRGYVRDVIAPKRTPLPMPTVAAPAPPPTMPPQKKSQAGVPAIECIEILDRDGTVIHVVKPAP